MEPKDAKDCCDIIKHEPLKEENDVLAKYYFAKGELLGKGGFAEVYKIQNFKTKKYFACKIISKTALKENQLHKIRSEINLHSELRDKNIVKFYSSFEDFKYVYIVLEYCPGKSLFDVLRKRKRLTEPEVRYYMRQLGNGVQYIHNQSVIHRDLKLANMFLSVTMQLKIGDFGLAIKMPVDIPESPKAGHFCGTPNYVAPEVLKARIYGYECDVWAMGCTMYAMLTGRPPFETNSLRTTYSRISRNVYTIPSCVSKAAGSLISSMLDAKPSDRPSISNILQNDFFKNGYTPETLTMESCTKTPKFPAINMVSSVAKPSVNSYKKLVPSEKAFLINERRCNPNDPRQLREEKQDSSSVKNGKKSAFCFQNYKMMKQKLGSIFWADKLIKLPNTNVPSSVQQKCPMEFVKNVIKQIRVSSCNPPTIDVPKSLYVTRWIDYSNKYGFCFQLSNGCTGVLFNDSAKFALSADQCKIEFYDEGGNFEAIPSCRVPRHLKDRLTLVKYFRRYMEEKLSDGCDKPLQEKQTSRIPVVKLQEDQQRIPFMRCWKRTPEAIGMHLSTCTFQVNFLKDHTKIAFNCIKGNVQKTNPLCLISYIDCNDDNTSFVRTYSLEDFRRFGCESAFLDRLQRAYNFYYHEGFEDNI